MNRGVFHIKLLKLFAVSAAAVLLTGCGLFSPAEGLLSPPKLSEEQREVYNALTDSAGDVDLVFPRNGKNRSAYIFADFDGDGSEEAAVFYRPAGGGEDVIRLNILDKREKKWRSVYDAAGRGTSVDKVVVSDIGSSGRKYITAGYNLITAGDKTLEVYSYEGGILKTVYSDGYSDFFVTDFTSDELNELIIVNGNTENHGAHVVMISDNENKNGIEETSMTELSAKSVSFENITLGNAARNTAALYIDEVSGTGNVFTEIIYSIGGNLRNPALVDGSEIISATERQTGYSSADADNDGITEIPVTELCAGYENEHDKLYLTNWCIFDNYGISRKYTGWYSRTQGWRLMFPRRWEGLITVRSDNITGAAVFCKYGGSLSASTELMRINAVSREESNTFLELGWQLITRTDDADYILKLADGTDEPLVLTFTEVKNNFYPNE